ncbi:MAG: response regulator transcription factor [Reichenbachiella sp.]|uniref:response regulator transcription factor n=2 Tax=Reichenbachiella sp. TaxID=2184521 RepID=UPI00329718D8
MRKISVVVADDHGLIRDGIQAMLKYEDSIEIVAEAENGLDATIQVEHHEPDVVLMDIMMPEMNGIEAMKKIKDTSPRSKIILMSMEISEEFISQALECGVSGYLPKDVRKATLISAIEKVHEGEEFFDSKVSEAIFRNYYKKKTKGPSAITKGSGKISKREEEILSLVCNGMTNKEISDQLFISVRTVDSHKSHIMEKLGLKNTVDLIKFSIKNGFIEI